MTTHTLEVWGCYLSPLWSHLDRGLMAPLKSRANGATRIAAEWRHGGDRFIGCRTSDCVPSGNFAEGARNG
jgi:hypothetical protein